MRFLANENFPYPGINVLRGNGMFVKSIIEDSPGISDKEVIEIATNEKLVILTFDRDYGEILFRYASQEVKPAVIYFKEKLQTPLASANKLLELISNDVIFEGRFTVVEDNSYRQRVY